MSSTPGDRKDLALVLRECLKTARPECWEEFIRLAQPVVASGATKSLSRWNCGFDLADDLIHDTFVKLFKEDYRVLRAFRGGNHAALCAYLRTIASTVVTDEMKRRGIPPISLDSTEVLEVSVEDGGYREVERRLLLERVEKCLSKQKERDRTIFWLYYRFGFRPATISAYPGIGLGKSGVETILFRLTKLVRDCVKRGILSAPVEGVRP